MDAESLFDVEPFRAEQRRVAVVRVVERSTLVLGSTQSADLVDEEQLAERGIALRRRRGGGGAVFLPPSGCLWVDAWIPRADPLWDPDVSQAAVWAGSWWVDALVRSGAGSGAGAFEVHQGRAAPGEFGDFVCFSGRGPGEVFFEGHKVVGLSQWRSRQGALFSMCAYQRWDPGPLAALLRPLHEMTKAQVSVLDGAAVGVADLMGRATDLAGLGHALVGSVAGWGAGPARSV